MSDSLLSVGLDVGTTSTQLVVSELKVENRASGFAVPEMEITKRRIRYKGEVHFTPLLGENLVDGAGVRKIVEAEYAAAGISREKVNTGAVIITGETSRKENARAVLDALSDYAGEFVVATAGPDLESVLAAKGAGAVAFSEETGKRVLHMDIGGGTSNLALIEEGKIRKTGCLNVGGRLLKLDAQGIVTYISPVLRGICPLKVGQKAALEQVREVARTLVQALEMAAGLREKTGLLEQLWTKESGPAWTADSGETVISFSGGVADCIENQHPWLKFGDMGPVLGQAIRESRLCRDQYRLGSETIRATVIGAGCHSAQLSGSTVFVRNVQLPIKNVPVLDLEHLGNLGEELAKQDGLAVIALEGIASPQYRQVREMAEKIASAVTTGPVLLCLQQDMAKALGQALALKMGADAQILCIDRVKLQRGSYLDVGVPVGPALPVVVKTLILSG